MDTECRSSPWDNPEFQERRRVDLLCREFEDRWRQGNAVSIEACIQNAAPELQAVLLPELIAVEWELLLEAGESPSAERYRERFPQQETILNQLALGSRFRACESADATTDDCSPLTLRPGDVFANYRILRQIGAGGMGAVFLAEIPAISHPVALKILEPAGGKSGAVAARFEREARLLSRLDHPGIVPLYAYGIHDGFQYLVMKAIPGISLSSVFSYHTDTASESGTVVSDEGLKQIIRIINDCSSDVRTDLLLDFAVQISEALQAVHAAGILHRDIKPSNILVTSAGRVFLTDFGLARHADTDNSLTLGGEFVGTPRYSAPETLDCQYSPQSDLYSLGLVLFELFSLRTPFQCGSRRELLKQKLSGVVSEMTGEAWARQDVQALILRLTNSSPSLRHQSAEELVRELKTCQDFHAKPSQKAGWNLHRTAVTCLALAALIIAATMSLQRFKSAGTSGSADKEMVNQDAKSSAVEEVRPFEDQPYTSARWLRPLQLATLPVKERIMMLDVSRDGHKYLAVTEKGTVAIKDNELSEVRITGNNTIRMVRWIDLTDDGKLGLMVIRDPPRLVAGKPLTPHHYSLETWSPADQGWIRLGGPPFSLPHAMPHFTHGLPEEMTPFVLIPEIRSPTIWHPLTRGFTESEFALTENTTAVDAHFVTTAAVDSGGKLHVIDNGSSDGVVARSVNSVETGIEDCFAVKFSPDKQWIVLAANSEIALVSTLDWSVTILSHDLTQEYQFAISSNSRFLALGHPHRGFLCDLQKRQWAGNLHSVIPMVLLSPRSCGPALLTIEASGQISETWFSEGAPPRRRHLQGPPITAAGFCDSGSSVAISTEPGSILVLKLDVPDNPHDKRILNRDFLEVQSPILPSPPVTKSDSQ